MEEKLKRWKQVKQKGGQSNMKPAGGSARNASAAGGVKRKLSASVHARKSSGGAPKPPRQLTDMLDRDPAFDKENQHNQIVPARITTVEKKPELLAKDLIRLAIAFERKGRIPTAVSVFNRASHVLTKKSAKLIERLARLKNKCPTAVHQAPSQKASTTSYVMNVLERDLMAVLNNGSRKELTELHDIGSKRAELVLIKRPYHKVEELRKVPGMSANAVANLYTHHTKWETHLQ